MTLRKLLTMSAPSVQGGWSLFQCSRTTLSRRIVRKDSFGTPNSLSGRRTSSLFSTLTSLRAQMARMRVVGTGDGQSNIDSPSPVLERIAEGQPEMQPADAPIPPESDTRSPFDRFRARRKALSVTDLVSGVWCEQQFEYSLERGFKRSTPAMRKGTRVHRALEEQVHTIVPVEVTTKEDRWGLKLFNMCQGLLSLRHGGLTRELNVFGFLNGQFIQGIIDEISYTNPSEIVAAKTYPAVASDKSSDSDSDGGVPLPIDLTGSPSPPSTPEHELIAYVSDTKTRASQTIPGGSQLRATCLQLMFYHHLLSGLHAGNVDFAKVLENFDLDGSKNFSDNFLSQIASLESEISLEELLEDNSLWGLWGILQRKLRESINTIGNTLAVSYRSQKYGDIMETKTFDYDEALLTEHLNHTMDWWQGKRPAVGVEIEEAWKCKPPIIPLPLPKHRNLIISAKSSRPKMRIRGRLHLASRQDRRT
ncbi:hypothetical protein L873DRAFT_130947 [Choiromyces venosus 120613-1]|uniref:Exonuclease V, mitochondrial n=1 Tax=Choiromyces venosus 120613-1 TaxID=1336337 RepID=A0A3N4J847_9PEZI|nr:hypothetical protein L873DRAFT_130947 [Choiromyces venosus 120613-1]